MRKVEVSKTSDNTVKQSCLFGLEVLVAFPKTGEIFLCVLILTFLETHYRIRTRKPVFKSLGTFSSRTCPSPCNLVTHLNSVAHCLCTFRSWSTLSTVDSHNCSLALLYLILCRAPNPTPSVVHERHKPHVDPYLRLFATICTRFPSSSSSSLLRHNSDSTPSTC